MEQISHVYTAESDTRQDKLFSYHFIYSEINNILWITGLKILLISGKDFLIFIFYFFLL